MFEYMGTGGVMNALWSLVVVVIVVTLIAGVALGGAEFLNPEEARSKAAKLNAETALINEELAHNRNMHELERQEKEQDLEVKRQRQEMWTELMGPITIITMVTASVVGLLLIGTHCYYGLVSSDGLRRRPAAAATPPTRAMTAPLPGASQLGGAVAPNRVAVTNATRAVHPDQVSYDGFLAHFYDYILHPNRSRAFYTRDIRPEIEDIYLTILTEAKIIAWQTSDRLGWILPRHIRCVDHVRDLITPRAFYSLASLCPVPEADEGHPHRRIIGG